jgi:hypothetical protein
MPIMQRAVAAIMFPATIVLAAAVVTGCQSHKRTYAENARLRSEAIALRDQVQSLERANAELHLQMEAAAGEPAGVDPEIIEITPPVVSNDIDRLSHSRDAKGEGRIDTLVVYVRSTDGRGRFTQMTGRLAVDAMVTGPSTEPASIGRITLTPTQVRDAYRSSVMGTHYTVELPVVLQKGERDRSSTPAEVTVIVSYDDGLTGRQLSATHQVALKNVSARISARAGNGD